MPRLRVICCIVVTALLLAGLITFHDSRGMPYCRLRSGWIPFWPTVTVKARPSAPRSHCKLQLELIALALDQYHADYGRYPPPRMRTGEGDVAVSWRVLLLPYLDYGPLFREYHLYEGWDSPHNRNLFSSPEAIFHCPRDDGAQPGDTSYVALVGTDTSTSSAGQLDGLLQAVDQGRMFVVIEVARSRIAWSEPRDVTVAYLKEESVLGNGEFHTGDYDARHLLFCNTGSDAANGTSHEVVVLPTATKWEEVENLLRSRVVGN